MKNKFFILLFSSVLFLSCEGIQDDRNKPVPDKVRITWLLSVEIDKLPRFADSYECAVGWDTFRIHEIKLPTLLKIPGAQLFYDTPKKMTITTYYKDSVCTISDFVVPYEPHITVEPNKINGSIVFDTTYHYPQKVHFKDDLNLGIEGYLHYRYD